MPTVRPPFGRAGMSVDPVLSAWRARVPRRLLSRSLRWGAAGKSPWVGGPICAEPLDDESAADSRQRSIKHLVTMTGVFQARVKAATHGASLSRGTCKPQIESVKKNMGSESFESSGESFAWAGASNVAPEGSKPPRGLATRRKFRACLRSVRLPLRLAPYSRDNRIGQRLVLDRTGHRHPARKHGQQSDGFGLIVHAVPRPDPRGEGVDRSA